MKNVFDIKSEPQSPRNFDEFFGVKNCKQEKARFSELPERLCNLKQISENKIKFLRVEKDIKELEYCTFRPKVNKKTTVCSVLQIYKGHSNFKVLKDTNADKDATQSQKIQTNAELIKKIKPNKPKTIHDKLYYHGRSFTKTSIIQKYINK